MAERRFLLVDTEVLPDVFVKVLEAKELLASGAVSNISLAARKAGISRSAFYKYKDYVFDAETGRETITVIATLPGYFRRGASPGVTGLSRRRHDWAKHLMAQDRRTSCPNSMTNHNLYVLN